MSNSDEFDRVCAQVRGCSLCISELPFGPRPVFQVHPDAKILIAGQAPGSKVHASGIPFDDASGERLRDWMGVDKEAFYNEQKIAILPLGFCYPGTGKSGDLPPRRECADTWRNQLLGLMPNIEMTLAIGKYAQDWHMPNNTKRNLTETVKSWRSFQPDVLPMPHPSPRNNRWLKNNPWFESQVLPTLKTRIDALLD